MLSVQNRHVRERFLTADPRQVALGQRHAVRAHERERHVDAALLGHDAHELPRRQRDLVRMRLAARDLALDGLTRFKRANFRCRLRKPGQAETHDIR